MVNKIIYEISHIFCFILFCKYRYCTGIGEPKKCPIANLDLNKSKKIPNVLPEQKIIPESEILNQQQKTK